MKPYSQSFQVGLLPPTHGGCSPLRCPTPISEKGNEAGKAGPLCLRDSRCSCLALVRVTRTSIQDLVECLAIATLNALEEFSIILQECVT